MVDERVRIQSLTAELEQIKRKLAASELKVKDLRIQRGALINRVTSLQGLLPQEHANMDRIAEEVAKEYDIPADILRGPDRSYYLTKPRGKICYRIRKELKSSYATIAKFLGDRDHATVLYLIQIYLGASPKQARKHRGTNGLVESQVAA